VVDLDCEDAPPQAGFIKFYYWKHDDELWQEKHLLGQPQGWSGKGTIARDFHSKSYQMNFWSQKGVYTLYDANLDPIYAGRAGLTKKILATVGA
jgi:hypothetical protein